MYANNGYAGSETLCCILGKALPRGRLLPPANPPGAFKADQSELLRLMLDSTRKYSRGECGRTKPGTSLLKLSRFRTVSEGGAIDYIKLSRDFRSAELLADSLYIKNRHPVGRAEFLRVASSSSICLNSPSVYG
jgi:hypothetical protein